MFEALGLWTLRVASPVPLLHQLPNSKNIVLHHFSHNVSCQPVSNLSRIPKMHTGDFEIKRKLVPLRELMPFFRPFKLPRALYNRGTQRQFSENICSEDDLRSRIFGTFVVKCLACLPLLGFSNI